jgi:polyphosphate glucokinase
MATRTTSNSSSARPLRAAKPVAAARGARAPKSGPLTLAIDVGGSGLKAGVLDAKGALVGERLRIDTPKPCDPKLLVSSLMSLVAPLPKAQRISVGFPGLVRQGVIVTAPNISTPAFAGFDLAAALQKALGAPCRVINDADMQGLAAVKGKGVEMVVTLGTGFGTALFQQGRLQVHLEIAHLPFRKGETYDQQLGDAARRDVGPKKWNARVQEALVHMHTLTGFDHLYIGGGNAEHLKFKLPKNHHIIDNALGVLGGIKLWDTQSDNDL